jgi:eukaryotic-like serine/threonine-protein kinase
VASIDSIGSYQILSTLGKGANSTIFHVRRKADSREYALKIVTIEDADDQKFLDQAKHEFRIAGMLSHANLIKIHALEMKKDWLFRVRKSDMLIEYVNGKTLDSVPIPNDQFVPLFYQVAAGLRHMHLRNVFHADLKPNNILYGKRGEVKIIDYGLAWIKGEAKDRVQGTPEYMAPETYKSKIVNERSDIYNFGATMYRIATMKLPPTACATGETLRVNSKAFAQMLEPVSDHNKALPKGVCDLIHRCLSYESHKRPESMSEVLDGLRAIAISMGTPVADDDSL